MTRQKIEQAIEAARAKVREVLAQAKAKDGADRAGYDFSAVTAAWLGAEIVGEKDQAKKAIRVAEEVQKTSLELEDLQKQLEVFMAAEKGLDATARADSEPAQKMIHPGTEPASKGRPKSLGEQVVGHETFKLWAKGQGRDTQIVLPDVSLKTLFETGAGWAPESLRTGFVAEAITRPIQVLDIVPSGRTGMASVVYMEETTRTPGAAGVAEGAQKPESVYALTERSKPVREIADSIPVTETQLEDVPMVESYLNGRLQFGIQQKLDEHIIDNGGDTDSIDGLLNVGAGPGLAGGIQVTHVGSGSMIEAILQGMTDVRVNGRAAPTHTLLNSQDWQDIRLVRDDSGAGVGTGAYMWGPPSESGVPRIWGLPIVLADALTAGTAIVGSFQSPWITLFERRGVVVQQGWVNDQFRENRRTIRASGRWALVVYRPFAFTAVEPGT